MSKKKHGKRGITRHIKLWNPWFVNWPISPDKWQELLDRGLLTVDWGRGTDMSVSYTVVNGDVINDRTSKID